MLVSVEVDNVPVQMEVDLGATLTVMNYSTFTSTRSEATAPTLVPSQTILCT